MTRLNLSTMPLKITNFPKNLKAKEEDKFIMPDDKHKPKVPSKNVIQIVSSPQGIVSLCDDGSMWLLSHNEYANKLEWSELPKVPNI